MIAESHHRRLDIQGLRAVAVLLVIACHAGLPVRGGFVGVDVFFVISGFVITGALARQWSTTGRIDFAAFYARRLRRLFPALALTVLVTSAISICLQPPTGLQERTAKTAIGAILLSANIVIPNLAWDYFSPTATGNPLLHTWSLSVEEQIYLFYPLLLSEALARGRRTRSAGIPLLVVGVAGLLSAGVSLLSTYSPGFEAATRPYLSSFYSSPARAWEFGAGALVALAAGHFARWPAWSLVWIGAVGGTLVLASAWLLNEGGTFPGVVVVVPVLGTAMLLVGGCGPASGLSRALSWPTLVWIGDRSYSWYLWHWPAIVFARLVFPGARWAPVLAAIASLPVAVCCHRYVENRIRHSATMTNRRFAWTVGAFASVALFVGGALWFGESVGWGQPWALGTHVVMQRGCVSRFEPERCRWRSPGAVGAVLLVGDSQAFAMADGVIPAASSLGYDTIVVSSEACPFAMSEPARRGRQGQRGPRFASRSCSKRNERLVQYAIDSKPKVVLIANGGAGYVTTPDAGQTWRENFSNLVRRLRSAGLGVIIVGSVPAADEQAARTSLLLRGSADRFTSMADHRTITQYADSAGRLVADDNPGTVVLDPATVLCDSERCRVTQAGTEFYSDKTHLSRSGALVLEESVRQALSAAFKTANF